MFNGERFSATAKYYRISDDQDTHTVNANALTDMNKYGKFIKIKLINTNINSCSIAESTWKVNYTVNEYIQGKKRKLP